MLLTKAEGSKLSPVVLRCVVAHDHGSHPIIVSPGTADFLGPETLKLLSKQIRLALVCAIAFAARLRAPFLLLSESAVGMVAVVAIVLSVAVDVTGGESVRNMSVLRGQNARRSCAAPFVSLSSTLLQGRKLPLHMLFLLLMWLSLPVCCNGCCWWWFYCFDSLFGSVTGNFRREGGKIGRWDCFLGMLWM